MLIWLSLGLGIYCEFSLFSNPVGDLRSVADMNFQHACCHDHECRVLRVCTRRDISGQSTTWEIYGTRGSLDGGTTALHIFGLWCSHVLLALGSINWRKVGEEELDNDGTNSGKTEQGTASRVIDLENRIRGQSCISWTSLVKLSWPSMTSRAAFVNASSHARLRPHLA